MKYKHQVQILQYGGSGHISCGGSVYKRNIVISAGHCCNAIKNSIDSGLDFMSDFSVKAGTVDISIQKYKGQIIELKNFTIHPNFSFSSPAAFYDVCVILLNGEFVANVTEISLEKSSVAHFNDHCYITGWGSTKVCILINQNILNFPAPFKTAGKFKFLKIFQEMHHPNFLHYAYLPIVHENICENILGKENFDRLTMICAGGSVTKFSYLRIFKLKPFFREFQFAMEILEVL